jgi:hypothetical protein
VEQEIRILGERKWKSEILKSKEWTPNASLSEFLTDTSRIQVTSVTDNNKLYDHIFCPWPSTTPSVCERQLPGRKKYNRKLEIFKQFSVIPLKHEVHLNFSMVLSAPSGPMPLIQFRNHFSQTVGFLGQVIRPSQDLYKHTNTTT